MYAYSSPCLTLECETVIQYTWMPVRKRAPKICWGFSPMSVLCLQHRKRKVVRGRCSIKYHSRKSETSDRVSSCFQQPQTTIISPFLEGTSEKVTESDQALKVFSVSQTRHVNIYRVAAWKKSTERWEEQIRCVSLPAAGPLSVQETIHLLTRSSRTTAAHSFGFSWTQTHCRPRSQLMHVLLHSDEWIASCVVTVVSTRLGHCCVCRLSCLQCKVVAVIEER